MKVGNQYTVKKSTGEQWKSDLWTLRFSCQLFVKLSVKHLQSSKLNFSLT